MDNCAIRVHGLRIQRGSREVLHGLGFALHRGSVTGLLGPSGCGKTTLLRAIVGVQIVTAGVIEVLGYPAGSPALRGMLGYSTQSPAVYGDLTVRENLRYFAAVLRTAESEVDRVIAETELGPHAGHIVEHLSGGERSRANLAAALLGSPDLLVLDEPTVGLDPVLRNDLWALFHRLARAGTSLLISSHVMDEAERCERLLLMREGRLLADDTPGALLARTGAADLEKAFLRLVHDGAVRA
ncbi:MAG: ABC transporter ATP-binding protein [Chloroflexota bacterium]